MSAPAPAPPPAFIEWFRAHRAADMKKAQERVAKELAQRAAEEELSWQESSQNKGEA